MRIRIRRFFLLFFLSLFTAFLVLGFTISLQDIHSSFRLSFFLRSLFSTLFRWISPLFWLSLLLTAFWQKETDTKIPETKVQGSNIFGFFILAFSLMISLLSWFNPLNTASWNEMISLSEYFLRLEKNIDESYENQNWDATLHTLNRYIPFFPENEKFLLLRDRIHENMKHTGKMDDLSRNEKVRALLDRARTFFEDEDYVSAFYYADLAMKASFSARQDAFELLQASQERLRSQGLSREEGLKQIRAMRIAEALNFFNDVKDERRVKAYFLLKELAIDYPDDAEIKKLMQNILEDLEQTLFWEKEALLERPSPGFSSVILSPHSRQFISIDRLVVGLDAVYAYDLEVINFDTNFTVSSHYHVPYAKESQTTLLLRALDEQGNILSHDHYVGDNSPSSLFLSRSFLDMSVEFLGIDWLEAAPVHDIMIMRARSTTSFRSTIDRFLLLQLAQLIIFIGGGMLAFRAGFRAHSALLSLLLRWKIFVLAFVSFTFFFLFSLAVFLCEIIIDVSAALFSSVWPAGLLFLLFLLWPLWRLVRSDQELRRTTGNPKAI